MEASQGEERHALWVVKLDGSHAEKLAEYLMFTYGGVDWTPDGKTLVYAALTDHRMQLFAIPRKGGPVRKLTSGDVNLFQPQVSPDGRLIAATRGGCCSRKKLGG